MSAGWCHQGNFQSTAGGCASRNDPWPPAGADAGILKNSEEHAGAKEEYAQSLTPQHQEDWQAPNWNSSERSQWHTSEEAQRVQMASTWEFSGVYP